MTIEKLLSEYAVAYSNFVIGLKTSEVAGELRKQILSAFEEKDKKINNLQIKLSACGVAALQNTEESIKQRITADNEYYSASYQDVCDAVDREMELRKQIADLKAENESLKCCWNCKYIYTRNCDRWMDAKGSEMYTRYEKCEKWEKR